jgi:hypothetical protein
MKHVRTFEALAFKLFKVGDIVKISSAVDNFKGKIGYISSLSEEYGSCDYNVLFPNDPDEYWFRIGELTIPSPEELEQYKLEQNVNKYNL